MQSNSAPERDQYIDNYIETLENLGKEDIHLVCYNFMPVFDWTRTELARMRPDGSTVLAYTQEAVDALDPEKMFDSIAGDMNGTVMPGWEPERMEHVKELFEMYKEIDDEKLFENLKYFLERIMPVVTNMTLTWQFIRMIRHGAYSDCLVSSSTRRTFSV